VALNATGWSLLSRFKTVGKDVKRVQNREGKGRLNAVTSSNTLLRIESSIHRGETGKAMRTDMEWRTNSSGDTLFLFYRDMVNVNGELHLGDIPEIMKSSGAAWAPGYIKS